MKRLLCFVAVTTTMLIGGMPAAQADTTSQAGVYANMQNGALCMVLVGNTPSGGSQCLFAVPDGATEVSITVADVTHLPAGAFVSFFPGDPFDRTPLCDHLTVAVPSGTKYVELRLATIGDFANRDACGFTVAGTIQAGFNA